jgi:hypothetical protein
MNRIEDFIEEKARDATYQEFSRIVSSYFLKYRLDLSEWFDQGKLRVTFTDKNGEEKTIVFFKNKDDENWQSQLEKKLKEAKAEYV